MTSIEVVAHGDRWAVRMGGDTRSEHLTREEAESEARRLGASEPGVGASEPTVREDDPTGLADVQDETDPAGGPAGGPSGVRSVDPPRETQAGL